MPAQPSSGLNQQMPLKPITPPGVKTPSQGRPAAPPQPGQPNFQGMQVNPQQSAWKPSVVAQIASQKGDTRTALSQGLFKPQSQPQTGAPMKTAASEIQKLPVKKPTKAPPKTPPKPKLNTPEDIARELGKTAGESFTDTAMPAYDRLKKLLEVAKNNPIPPHISGTTAGAFQLAHGAPEGIDVSRAAFGRTEGGELHDKLTGMEGDISNLGNQVTDLSNRPKPGQDWRSMLLGAGGAAAIGGLGYGAYKMLKKPKKEKAASLSASLGKLAAAINVTKG
jgi:hypothetical protein